MSDRDQGEEKSVEEIAEEKYFCDENRDGYSCEGICPEVSGVAIAQAIREDTKEEK